MAARTIPTRGVARTAPRPRVPAKGSGSDQLRSRDRKVAGLLLSLAGAAILMGFITAEAL